jgi:hypothetical protein
MSSRLLMTTVIPVLAFWLHMIQAE